MSAVGFQSTADTLFTSHGDGHRTVAQEEFGLESELVVELPGFQP